MRLGSKAASAVRQYIVVSPLLLRYRARQPCQAAGLHQQSNENEPFSENLNAKLPFWFLHAVLQSFGRLTELCRQFEQRGFRVKFCGLIREFHTILGLSPI